MSSTIQDYALRPATAADAPGIIALVDGVYHEYGDRVHLEDADKDLLDVGAHYGALRGECVVLASGARIVGLHAVVPLADQPGVCTFRRLYLAPQLRGTGWGTRLMQWAIERARELGFRRVEFWSDTRFARAHRFFERLGFERDGRARTMHDAWEPYEEYFFYRELTYVRCRTLAACGCGER
jgi:putative acetyltransferase